MNPTSSLSPQSSALPTLALSIRQPWAWLIVHGYKDIENRSRCIKDYLGPVLIHASAECTQLEINRAMMLIKERFAGNMRNKIIMAMPWVVDEFKGMTGGIVGMAEITGHGDLDLTKNPWWTGPYGYRLANAKPLPFMECKGRLGFFRPDLKSVSSAKSVDQ